MRSTKLPALIVALGWCSAESLSAAVSPELADLAARIDYGFYTDDARAIEAALAVLERSGDDPDAAYYRDFAVLRLAQLAPDARAGTQLVSDCAGQDVPAEVQGAAAAESWILVAACAAVADSGRRMEQALARARALDDDNPRIAFVEAWALQRELADDPALHDTVVETWRATVAGFDTWSAPPDAPQWGYAEALAALGELTLQRGEARLARDLIERALLLAPDYRFALALRSRLQGSGASQTP